MLRHLHVQVQKKKVKSWTVPIRWLTGCMRKQTCHHLCQKSVTSTERSREDDEEFEDSVATKVPATTYDSSSSTGSSSSSTNHEDDQKIDGEGGAVMHMNLPALSDEYKLYISATGVGPELRQSRGQSVCDVAEIFSPPKTCYGARARGLRGGWSLDSGALCPLTGRRWDLSYEAEQKKAWNLFCKTKPKLLIVALPRLDQDWSSSQIDMAANMSISQCKAGRKFVFEHPASSSSWSLPCVKRLADSSGIYSLDVDMRLFTNSLTTDGLVDKRIATDWEHDFQDAFIDDLIMEEIHEQNEERLKLMPLADMCDPEEEKQLMESIAGIDDVSGEPMDPSLIVKARQEEVRGFTERGVYHHVPRRVAEADPEGKFIGVRWVDVRSRLVGQEFAHGQRRDDLYAPTPQLAAAWCLLSTCASWVNKVLETIAYSCWTSVRLSSMVRFQGPCTSSYLPKIRCSTRRTWWANLTKQCTGREMLLRRGRRSWRRL